MNHLTGFGLLFLAAGGFAVWGGVDQLRRKREQARRSVAATARVTGVESDDGDEGPTWYWPVVAFDAGGKAVRAKLLKGSTRRDEYRTGGKLTVYYDPGDPTQVVARRTDFPGRGAAVVIGVVFLLAGGGLLWAGRNGG